MKVRQRIFILFYFVLTNRKPKKGFKKKAEEALHKGYIYIYIYIK